MQIQGKAAVSKFCQQDEMEAKLILLYPKEMALSPWLWYLIATGFDTEIAYTAIIVLQPMYSH